MERLLEILEEINPDIDFENCTTLIDDGLLDSFAILEIVAEINDAFDVEVSAPEIIPENFNSAQALWAMMELSAILNSNRQLSMNLSMAMTV